MHGRKGLLLYLGIFFLIFALGGCAWFSKGLMNILNPEAEIRMYYLTRSFDVGGAEKFELMNGVVFDLIIYPLNEVGFTIERLEYRYSTPSGPVNSLDRSLYLAYYVPPRPYPQTGFPTSAEAGAYAIRNLPLVFQEGIDYLWKNYREKTLFLDLTVFVRDDAGHTMERQVIAGFPVLEMGEDFFAPTVTVVPSGGSFPRGSTLTFVAQAKDDYMIKSYQWFVNGTSSSGCPEGAQGAVFTYTFSTAGTYSILVKVCDYAGNCSYGVSVVTITAS